MACATVELLCLAVWIGGLIVIIASVIPAVFNSFGMEPGGRFLTRVFEGYDRLVMIVSVAMLSCLGLRSWLTPRVGFGPSRTELVVLPVMVLIAVLILGVLGPRSVSLQEEAFTQKGEAEKKAAYSAFFAAHNLVRGLYLANLGLGITLLMVKVKQSHQLSAVRR
jgi:uncharacterized membrane protein